MIARLASWSFRHRGVTVVSWIVLALAATVAAGAVRAEYSSGGRLPGTDSDRAYQILAHELPRTAGEEVAVVFQVPGGVGEPAARAPIEHYLTDVAAIPGVAGVDSPFADPARVSANGTIASAGVTFVDRASTDTIDAATASIESSAASLRGSGVRVEFAGGWFNHDGVPATEGFGVLAAAIILLVSFGSALAMGLPLLTALLGVVLSLAGVGFVTAFANTPDFTPEVAMMIGIGVGIDYALFLITRYRRELATTGRAPLDALRVTMSTAGRAVVLAGSTVVVSLLGMLVVGLDLLHGLAFGSAIAVAVAVAGALTLLPALLAFVSGPLSRSAARSSRRTARRPVERVGMWRRWGQVVQRRPAVTALGGLAVLVILTLPLFGIRLASTDAGNDPAGSTTRAAYDLLAEGFGAGANGALLVVVDQPAGVDRAAVERLAGAIAATPDVVSVTPAQLSSSGRAAVLTVVPATSPQSPTTEHLVSVLRHDVIPASGVNAHVGGQTASNVDFAQLMGERLPLFIGAVLALSFLLLLVEFRSVLVPLKAVVMNLLSIGAAYGVLVAIFQWGWFGSVVGIEAAPIEPWLPMLLFAIVFGLSMDYEVFLLSAIKERYDATGDNATAVVDGLASTARVITAAAAIMVFVFGSFVFGDLRSVKEVGVGLGVAVLVDATVVRLVLVPSTMELLGAGNWWFPRWRAGRSRLPEPSRSLVSR